MSSGPALGEGENQEHLFYRLADITAGPAGLARIFTKYFSIGFFSTLGWLNRLSHAKQSRIDVEPSGSFTFGHTLERKELASKILEHVAQDHLILIEAPPCSGKTVLMDNLVEIICTRLKGSTASVDYITEWTDIVVSDNAASAKVRYVPTSHSNPPNVAINNVTDLEMFICSPLRGPFWLFVDESQMSYGDKAFWKTLLLSTCSNISNFWVVAAGSYGSHTGSASHSPVLAPFPVHGLCRIAITPRRVSICGTGQENQDWHISHSKKRHSPEPPVPQGLGRALLVKRGRGHGNAFARDFKGCIRREHSSTRLDFAKYLLAGLGWIGYWREGLEALDYSALHRSFWWVERRVLRFIVYGEHRGFLLEGNQGDVTRTWRDSVHY
ncbi:hypothetical protein BT96DRAFT_945842 [Gymnopus androsaceus JB14]|uniref:Uncharacterized protein n=1 Tax=Gymnopus androsaceus JB14 TaxID=1447944 RepID=A0A6A4GZ73_9AGAR|nr:hypothetical protein BT96DRAFT_945842 [Gymnopus androsaceus JB14]